MDNQELLAAARSHQRSARATAATPQHAFLITSGRVETTCAHVTHLSGKHDKPTLLTGLQDSPPSKRDSYASEREAMQVLAAQKEDRSTIQKVGQFNTAEFLPGGIPVLDHLAAFVHESPDWRGLIPTLEELRNTRLPSPEGTSDFKELTLGVSTPEEWSRARSVLLEHLEKDRETLFPFCAVDTESVQVRETWDRAPGETAEGALLFHLRSEIQKGRKERNFTVEPRKYSHGTKAGIPVRLMVAGKDWHIHIRLPTETELHKGYQYLALRLDTQLCKEVGEFFRALPVAVGVDITEDYVSWARLMFVLWGDTSFEEVPRPIELGHLARAVRINDTSCSVFHLHWWLFGTLIPKDHASMGDGMWGDHYRHIADPLRMYLNCDLQQVVKMATILSLVWAAQTFPDLTLVKAATHLNEVAFLRWVQVTAVPQLFAGWLPIERNEAGRWMRAVKDKDWEAVSSPEGVVDRLRPPNRLTYSKVWEVPAWPSITQGGCRYLLQARAATIKMLDQLHKLDPSVWPGPEVANDDKKVLWMFGVPLEAVEGLCKTPVHSTGLLPLPGMESMLPENPFSWKREDHLMPAKRRFYGASDRPMVLMHMRLHPETAAQVLRFAEQDVKGFRALLKHSHVLKLIREIREMLGYLNITITRPNGWRDPYPMEGYISQLEQRVEGHLKRRLEMYHKNSEFFAQSIQKAKEVLEKGKRAVCYQTAYFSQMQRASAAPKDPKRPRMDEQEPEEEEGSPEPPRNVVVRDEPEEEGLAVFHAVDPSGVVSRTRAKRRNRRARKRANRLAALSQQDEPTNCNAADPSGIGSPSKVGDTPASDKTRTLAKDVFPINGRMEETIKTALARGPGISVAPAMVFPIESGDLKSFVGDEWLTGSAIEAYLHLLPERARQEGLPSVYVFGSYFYTTLVSQGNAGVLRYTRSDEIFSHDLVIIPNHLVNHWTLTVVDMRSGLISTYDSKESLRASVKCEETVLQYLKYEHWNKKGEPLPERFRVDHPRDVPQQVGSNDCGIFTCRFAEAITRGAPLDFGAEDMDHFRKLAVWEVASQRILKPGGANCGPSLVDRSRFDVLDDPFEDNEEPFVDLENIVIDEQLLVDLDDDILQVSASMDDLKFLKE